MLFSLRRYSLLKCRHILEASYKWYQAHPSSSNASSLRELLHALDEAIVQKDRITSDRLARELEAACQPPLKKSALRYLCETVCALVVALLIATVVRQMWFELYEIPTGSMRPTFKEKDRLTVTKTAFGVNIPLKLGHFYFDPDLVQRTSVIIWSGEEIPYLNSDSTFMGVIPYKKRFIKRCMGKPGDLLYFYGGKIYGVDQDGNELKEFLNAPWIQRLEYLPFNHFEGRPSYVQDPSNHSSQVLFHQINQKIGRFRLLRNEIKGEIFNGKEWIKDRPEAQKKPHAELATYSDFWGIRNFALCRLLTREEVERYTPYSPHEMEKGVLYLELRHTPSLSFPPPLIERMGIGIRGYSTVIPLQEKQLQALRDTLYTCRFLIQEEKGYPYRMDKKPKLSPFTPSFPGIPNGTYEFYYGKALKIIWGGIAQELPSSHPLYSADLQLIQKLFNFGIEMSTQVAPSSLHQFLFPSRYAYFREGDLYVMGGVVFEKKDPLLLSFHQREKKREETSSKLFPYVAFKDYGPPLTAEGKIDAAFLKVFGFKVPDGHYLMLGDNHAMSQDSRWFGPIPQSNLQGAPSLIVWPPGERFGIPPQKPYPLFSFPRLLVWSIILLILALWWTYNRRKLRSPFFHTSLK